ncbi:dihydroneopterin aldolase [Sphingomonas sp. SUN019]|uniref:dihydroneopterin aldolase n=1 Tax=Sphingomonas sp. SUN019 TaxID=2937788 RepID=UPI0021644B46|nr:dihydroneopterin aldolase [Sphingomonas sp. SUN019]UVO50611.1 dihydroneopterin aldolase [Sphingomonas sp. SUN019]
MAMVVHVDDLTLSARIGINPDEQDRRQPLVISVELTLRDDAVESIMDSVDYRRIVAEAETIADRHTGMIEVFARQLAERCLALGPVADVTVRVAKPQALSRGLASVRVTLEAAQAMPRAVALAAL